MDPLYLDHAAATPMRPEVRDAMEPLLGMVSGNPSAVHRWGRSMRAALDDARERCAAELRVRPDEIVFTRGGTEANNLAILGRARWARRTGSGASHFVRSTLEHSSVREPFESLVADGCPVDVIEVERDGTVGELPSRESTALVSMQWVNQETGITLPVPEVAEVCAARDLVLHVDAVQAAGKVPMALDRVPASLLTISGHKLGGPRGTGLLFVRKGTGLAPVLFGGGQEHGLRPGTEDVAGAVGFAVALELSIGGLEAEAARLRSLRDRLEVGLLSRVPSLRVIGPDAPRAPHILAIGVPGLPRDLLPGALDLEGVAVSAGSACRSGSTEPSAVLQALHGSEAADFALLRLSLGWTTTEAEIESAIDRIGDVVERTLDAGVRS